MHLKYYFRSKSMEHLRQLALDIGWLKEVTDKEGHTSLCVTDPGTMVWDEVGAIYERVGGTDLEPLMEPVKDKDGNVLQHVNFLWNHSCRIDPADGLPMKWSLLIERATEIAKNSSPEVEARLANALGTLSMAITYDGKVAEDPKTPVRVFA